MPSEVLPPGRPFTVQVTAVFALPLTLALNCCVAPTLKFAEDGDTVTEIAEGDPGETGVEFAGAEVPAPPHPKDNKQKRTTAVARQLENGRKVSS